MNSLKVKKVINETHDVSTFVIDPNADGLNWILKLDRSRRNSLFAGFGAIVMSEVDSANAIVS